MSQAFCTDEAGRLAALHDLGILDTPREPRFDRIARLAKAACNTPIAVVSLVDAHRQWFKAAEGLSDSQTPREDAFCAHALGQPETLWVEDATKDERFAENRLVLGDPHIRFYAGAPIRLSSGYLVGTVCVIDSEPRTYDPKIDAILTMLAGLAADEMEAGAAKATINAFVDNAPTSLVMTDLETRVLRVSQMWSELYELEPEEVFGRTLAQVFPGLADEWTVTFGRVLDGKVERGVSKSVMTSPGSDRWFKWSASPWRDAVGRIAGLLVATQDVTDLVRASRTAERDAQRWKLALAISKILVWEADLATGVVTWSGDPSVFFDATPDALTMANGGFDYALDEDRPALRQALAAHDPSDGAFRREFRLDRDGGRVQWVRAEQETIRAGDGAVCSIIGVVRDITKARQGQQDLEDAMHAAERASHAKSQFLANMSHEIRTPLNGVLGIVSALARTPLSAEQTSMVSLIERSGQALNTLLSDILDVSRMEAGQLEIAASPFDLNATMEDLASLFAPMAADKGVRLEVQGFDGPTWVIGDAARLRQILTNLLTNALKFTEEGLVRLEVSGPDENNDLTFAVRDTGIGFATGDAERLFDRFHQVDASSTRRHGGVGLGLAISRILAELMGGALNADGQLGKGATFTLRLALPTTEAVENDAPKTQIVSAIRVLLAEDNPVNQQVVRLILDQVNADLVIVDDGQAAVAAFVASHFDLVLMDMQMPIMDGLSAVRAIRAYEAENACPRTPIKTLSANALPEHRQAALEAGADDHLPKPITAAGLIGAIVETLGSVEEP